MQKNIFHMPFLILLVITLFVSGCKGQLPEPKPEEGPGEQEVAMEDSEEQDEAPEVSPEENTREELPEKIETTFFIEGMEEPVTLLLFQHEAMPFHTYYPEDMLFEEWVYDKEKGVRFYANFGGTINKNAYVEIKLFSEEMIGGEDDFIRHIAGEEGILQNRGVEWVEKESEMDRIFPWTIIEYYYLNDEFVGSLYLGSHEENYFYLDVHYPWEYGDGMESRAHVIIKEFMWTQPLKGLMQ